VGNFDSEWIRYSVEGNWWTRFNMRRSDQAAASMIENEKWNSLKNAILMISINMNSIPHGSTIITAIKNNEENCIFLKLVCLPN
jgi:hypothetical protein